MEESNFDKKGFFFFARFAIVLLALAFVSKYGTQLATGQLSFSLGNQEQEAKQVAAIIALKQFDESEREIPQTTKKITLGFVGDIMLDRGIKANVEKYGHGDYNYTFEKVKSYLNGFDALFGNLEGPISDKGNKQGSIYSFRMKPESAKALGEAGFDILSVANNHIGDWGREAMKDTFVNLAQSGIVPVGGGADESKAYEPKTIEASGIKIGYIAMSQFGRGYLEAGKDTIGIAIISDEKLKTVIEKAKSQNDIAIVSFHFGDEYKKEPNSYQKNIARKAIDYGADLVVGHHPHVIEPIEKYKDGWIAYSLGNFVFDQHFSKDTMEGIVLKADIENKKIAEVSSDKIIINTYYQPGLADGLSN